jgi:hypothetical protein
MKLLCSIALAYGISAIVTFTLAYVFAKTDFPNHWGKRVATWVGWGTFGCLVVFFVSR